MADDDLYALLQLLLVPGLTLVGGHCGAEDRYPKPCLLEHLRQPPRHIMLACERGVDLTPSALPQFVADVLNEAPLLGVGVGFRKAGRLGDEEGHHAALLLVVPFAPDLLDVEGVVRIAAAC